MSITNKNVFMCQRFTSRSNNIDDKYWEDLGFPIIEPEELKNEQDLDKYSKIYVRYTDHSAVSLSTSLNPSKSDFDSDDWIVWFIKTKDEKIVNQFGQRINSYFKELEHAINGFGFEYDEQTFWDYTAEGSGFYDDIKENQIKKAIEEAIKNKSSKPLDKIMLEVEENLNHQIENKSVDLYKKYEDQFDEYYQECMSDIYMDDDGIRYEYAFQDLENEIENINSNKSSNSI